MAYQEHVEILMQGVEAWNNWRRENTHIFPDLSGAKLVEADLRVARLDETYLSGADLRKARLKEAYLHTYLSILFLLFYKILIILVILNF